MKEVPDRRINEIIRSHRMRQIPKAITEVSRLHTMIHVNSSYVVDESDRIEFNQQSISMMTGAIAGMITELYDLGVDVTLKPSGVIYEKRK